MSDLPLGPEPKKPEPRKPEPKAELQRNVRSYPPKTPNDSILDRFKFHPATPTTGPKHDQIRKAHEQLAKKLLTDVPAGRHQSLALTALQESMMWCNAAIANDTPVEG